ncbi:MAG: SDR family NAD(P)-dependent oxidoreductase [Bdellovibrionales bacterium]|nr:SDR family NAD(P)-dependent oxidoreductase [Bdellovibrionales bacterium]NQZ19533.1 SDR family NAD(P)-dependent oxidoreductase [Bdellovibrionales bacterium]
MNQKSILVTGGNRGIGLATVKKLAENPNNLVYLGCRDLKEGESIASTIGDNVKAIEVNLSDQNTLATNIDSVKKLNIDVLINNAGVLNEGAINATNMEKVNQSFQVNTLGPIQLIQALLPSMIKNGFGRIVNVSSGWGSFDDGLTGPFSYSVTKAALNAVTLSVANGLSNNVKINSMCPGWVRTRMGGMMASRSPEQGAETIIWLAELPEDGPNGGFFRDNKLIEW